MGECGAACGKSAGVGGGVTQVLITVAIAYLFVLAVGTLQCFLYVAYVL